MKKRFLSLGALALAALTTVTACGNKGGSSTNTIVKFAVRNYTVEIDGWTAVVEKANELLEKDNVPVRIQLQALKVGSSWDDYYTRIAQDISAGRNATIGRIAESHMPKMRAANLSADITDLANKLIATGEYNTTPFSGVAKEGDKYYGLPSGLQHMVIFYNKDKFDNYNKEASDADKISYPSGDWSNASTFAEIRHDAECLTKGDGASRQFGFSAGPFLAYAGMYAKNSGGYNIFDENGQCKIYTQEFIDVYDWLGEMLYDSRLSPNIADSLDSGGLGKFCSGNTAMIVDGIYNLHDIMTKCKFNVGVAAIPVKENGAGGKYKSYTTNFTDCYFAARTSKHKEEDKIALEYLMKSECVKTLADYQVGGVPIKKDCVEYYFDKLQAAGLNKEACDVIKAGANNTISVPYSSYYNDVDTEVNAKLPLWMNKDPNWTTDIFVKFIDTEMNKRMPP